MRIRIARLAALIVSALVANPALAQPASAGLQNPTGVITLADAVSLALRHSPELAAFDWGRRAAEARQVQSGKRSNPIASMTLDDVGGTSRAADIAAAIQPQATIQLSQLVELGGKRAARQQVARLDTDLAEWDYEAARLEVLSRVTSAFYAVLAGQDAERDTARSFELAQQVSRTVSERVTAGVVSPIEETRTEVLVASAQRTVDQARRTLEARRVQLSVLWGQSTATFQRADGDLSVLPAIPDLTVLIEALVRTPSLIRWTAEVERRQAALAVARALRVPDLTVSAGYRRFTSLGSQAFVLGAAVPLPWFDRNHDGIRAADAAVSRSRAEADAARLHLQSGLAEAHRALLTAGDEVVTLRTKIIPGAQAVFDAVREGYQLGRFGLLDVLDAQRLLTEANREYREALATVHQAASGVERLVGRSLADIGRPK
jgi:cobalt-zinc-cadmium efflux system outer membrane protein